MVGISDAKQLAFAAGQNRVIFTFNRGDFLRLHTECLKNEQMQSWLEFLSSWR